MVCLGGGSTSMFTSGGVHFCVHFWGGPLPCSLLGGPLLCSLPRGVPQPAGPSRGGSTSMFTSGGFTSGGGPLPCSLLGGSTSMFTSRGSHVTYPIMLLYTTIECPSTSWVKFTLTSPPPPVEETDRQTLVKTLPSHTTCGR